MRHRIAGSRRRLLLTLLAIACANAGEAWAATRCELPAVFAVVAEERGIGGRGVVVVPCTGEPSAGEGSGAASGSDAGPRPGDVVRQANGNRVDRCVDLESAAAEAFAKGLRLLLLVERDGDVRVLAAPGRLAEGAAVAATHDRGKAAGTATAADGRTGAAAEPRKASGGAAPRAAARVRPGHHAHVETALPARGEVPAETIAAATAALAPLRALAAAAEPNVPLALYERRLADAERAVDALGFPESAAAATVRAALDEIVAYHRTADAIWRARLAYLTSRGTDPRAARGQPLPYFSDSPVADWVGEYPFLQPTLLTMPQETRVLPGESAGTWDAERAVALLWARGRESTERLAAWLGG